MLCFLVPAFFRGASFSLLMLSGHLFYLLEMYWGELVQTRQTRDFSKSILATKWKQPESFAWLHCSVTVGVGSVSGYFLA